jgi:hypothetical protein
VAAWFLLGLALCWSVAIRVPLVLNAQGHLDSDLAVDGLTLLDVVQGRWRWHYPGTPYMGIGPVFLSWLQGRVWGVNPITLVSGGVVAHVLIILATFALGWRAFGREAAVWSLIPLTFVSTGVLWMSGRITGGHLLIVAWSAVAWLLCHEVLTRGGPGRWCFLGLWCGLGLWHDPMFVMTLAGMTLAGLFAAWLNVGEGTWAGAGVATSSLAFLAALLAGASPRFIGRVVDPHDAYNEQFSGSLDPGLLAEHGRILALDCLPRLIAGHRLPGLEADPDPALLGTGGPIQQSGSRGKMGHKGVALALTFLSLGSFAAAMVGLCALVVRIGNAGERAVAAGLLATTCAVVAGFLINRNIFNSDNSRYLVPLLIPWAIGLGIFTSRAGRAPGGGVPMAVAAVGLAFLFTADTAAWYRRLGWVDEKLVPVRRRVEHPVLRWLDEHPGVGALYGDYWDVYLLAFLTSGKVRGVPFPIYPNRFPEWSAGLREGRPETMLARPTRDGQYFLNAALRDGGKIVHQGRGFSIVSWPVKGPEPEDMKATTGSPVSRRAVRR